MESGKIYEIVGGGMRYIGSTVQSLERRLQKHKSNKTGYELKKPGIGWTSSYDILDQPDCCINLLLDYPCKSKEELRKKEGEYILSLPCVNKVVPGRTQSELLSVKRETYNASAREKNKQTEICDTCNKTITKCNMNRHKRSCGTEKISTTGYKHIYKPNQSSYQVQIIRKNFKICKNFNILEDAVAFRDANLS